MSSNIKIREFHFVMSCGASACLRHFIITLLVFNEGFTKMVSCKTTLEDSKAKIAKDNELCKRQMHLLVSGYQEKAFWALKVFDSWGKSQSGIFSQNLVNFGHYEQCLQSKYTFNDPDDGTFQGQHCMIFFEDAPNVTVNPEAIDLLLPIMVHIDLMRQYMNFYKVEMGTAICLPTTCSTQMVRLIADAFLSKNRLQTTKKYRQESFCNTINILEMRNTDMFAALFFSFMALLLILSTAYDLTMRHNDQEQQPLLAAFSVYTNGMKLFETNEKSSKDIIDCLHGIRALSIIWIIHGQRVLTYARFPIINRVQFRDDWMKSWSSVLSTSTPMAIDTFFLLSGLLSTKTILRRLDENGKLNVGSLYLHRYLRITPVLAATIFCFMTLQRYFGDGPYNIAMIDEYYTNCEIYWFAAVLHIQNFVNPHNVCLAHTWYLSTDFQLFLLSPLLVYPLWKFGRKILMTLPILCIASILFIFLSSYEHGFQALSFLNSDSTAKLYNYYVYMSFYSRICPYLCGMMTAYVLHTNEEAITKFPKHLSASLWISSISIIFALIIGTFPFHSSDNVPSKLINSVFIAASHLGWSASVAWIIFACHSGSGGAINRFLSLQMWKPLSRIGLSVYLTHVLSMIAVFGTQKQPGYYNEFLTTHIFFGDLALAYGIAVLAFLTFEASFVSIENSFKIMNQKGQKNEHNKAGKEVKDEL